MSKKNKEAQKAEEEVLAAVEAPESTPEPKIDSGELEVVYYKTSRPCYATRDHQAWPLAAGSIVSRLTHDLAELEAQGCILEKV